MKLVIKSANERVSKRVIQKSVCYLCAIRKRYGFTALDIQVDRIYPCFDCEVGVAT